MTPTQSILELTSNGGGGRALLRTALVGANPHASISGVQELPGRINYYRGSDPAGWRTGVATYEKVRYEEVYRGINLIYYGNQEQLEYHFEVAPGANPGTIQLKFEGADRVRIDPLGDLVIRIADREIRHLKPVAFQRTRERPA